MSKQTKEELLAKKREWYHKNIEKSKATSKKSRDKHKGKRKLENKLWIENNKDYLKNYHKEYHKKWYEKNKEKRSLQLKEYNKSHKKECVVNTQKYTLKNKAKVYAYGIDYSKTSKGRFRTYKSSAIRRKHDFDLTSEDFVKITSSPCVYCGESTKKIGIDRIDNSKGYLIENCAPCCTICNMMKKTMKLQDFLSHITKIHNKNLIN